MIHIADPRKIAISTPFQGVLPPSGQHEQKGLPTFWNQENVGGPFRPPRNNSRTNGNQGQPQLFITPARRWLSRDWHTPLPLWRGYRLAR